MQITTALSFSQGLPTPIIRSYHKDKEYITLSLSPREATEEEIHTYATDFNSGGVPTPSPEDAPLLAHTAISIINPHAHLSLFDILHIIYLNAIEITAPELAALADTYAITDYDTLVPILIRARYTADDEFAIQRKAILGDLSEFTPYNEYVESCKSLAHAVFL